MSLAKNCGWIWLDGALIPGEEAKIHCLNYSLHYGAAVFEGLRAYSTENGAAIFRLREHTQRLLNSCKILGIEVPYSLEQLEEGQKKVITKNNFQSAYIRPLIFSGSEALGLHAKNLSTHAMIAAWDWLSYLGGNSLQQGIRVKISSFSRHSSNSAMSKAKATGNYLNSVMAVREIVKQGYDEALLLDKEGYIAEGSGQNFFMVRQKKLITPDLSNILEGITRDTVIQLAHEFNLSVEQRRITRDEAYIADEVFFTGTASEILPIIDIDGFTIGTGVPGSLTLKIQQAFFDIVKGKNNKYKRWLTYAHNQ